MACSKSIDELIHKEDTILDTQELIASPERISDLMCHECIVDSSFDSTVLYSRCEGHKQLNMKALCYLRWI
jgi:hypothetical protein